MDKKCKTCDYYDKISDEVGECRHRSLDNGYHCPDDWNRDGVCGASDGIMIGPDFGCIHHSKNQ